MRTCLYKTCAWLGACLYTASLKVAALGTFFDYWASYWMNED